MKRPSFPLGAALGALAVTALLGACATELAEQRFAHATHLEGLKCGEKGQPACLACPSCHLPQKDTGVQKLPEAKVCIDCHQTETAKQSVPPRSPLAPKPAAFDISFNHEKHLKNDEIKGQCVGCHRGISGDPNKAIFPPMSTCLNCHEHQEQFAANDCTPCHATGAVRTLKPVSFLPHDQLWMKRHGEFVRNDPKACVTCHAQAQCDACHDTRQSIRPELRNPDAIERQYVHRFDFLSRHGIESRSEPGQCFSCHARQECDACHTQRGVSGGSNFGRNPHPLNWAAGTGAGGNLHGQEARRDLVSCAACHDQGPLTNCVRCHKVGGFGGNPHPPGWATTQPPDSSSCRACHGGTL